MGTGYLMALVYLYTSHQRHDGKPGLSIDDIAENYYGNRSGTRLEAAVRGSMGGYLQQLEDRHQIVAWLKGGASEKGYSTRIRPILINSGSCGRRKKQTGSLDMCAAYKVYTYDMEKWKTALEGNHGRRHIG